MTSDKGGRQRVDGADEMLGGGSYAGPHLQSRRAANLPSGGWTYPGVYYAKWLVVRVVTLA